MEGQYTAQEMREMIAHAQSKRLDRFADGIVMLRNGVTNNYYSQHLDGSWTNYDCKTVYHY